VPVPVPLSATVSASATRSVDFSLLPLALPLPLSLPLSLPLTLPLTLPSAPPPATFLRVELTFRSARADDDCRELIYSAAPELYDYMFARGSIRAQDYIAHEFRSGRGFIGHRIHTVAIADGRIVGVGAFYTRDQYGALERGSGLEILRFYRFTKIPSVVRAAGHAGSVLKKPRPGDVYIANLGVHPDARGNGVGSALIAHESAKAKAAGFQKMTLDVADNNPRAQALYERLGFEVIREKQFKGDGGAGVPNLRFMKRPL